MYPILGTSDLGACIKRIPGPSLQNSFRCPNPGPGAACSRGAATCSPLPKIPKTYSSVYPSVGPPIRIFRGRATVRLNYASPKRRYGTEFCSVSENELAFLFIARQYKERHHFTWAISKGVTESARWGTTHAVVNRRWKNCSSLPHLMWLTSEFS